MYIQYFIITQNPIFVKPTIKCCVSFWCIANRCWLHVYTYTLFCLQHIQVVSYALQLVLCWYDDGAQSSDLCKPMDLIFGLTLSMGFFRNKSPRSRLPFLSGSSNTGIEPVFLYIFSAVSRFFTTGTTWESLIDLPIFIYSSVYVSIPFSPIHLTLLPLSVLTFVFSKSCLYFWHTSRDHL